MAYNDSTRILPEPCRSLGFASIVAGYTAIGDPLAHPSRMLIVQNMTDDSVWFSWDGVENHVPLQAGVTFVHDITANAGPSGSFASKGTQFHIKRLGTPTAGSVYISSFYGKEV